MARQRSDKVILRTKVSRELAQALERLDPFYGQYTSDKLAFILTEWLDVDSHIARVNRLAERRRQRRGKSSKSEDLPGADTRKWRRPRRDARRP